MPLKARIIANSTNLDADPYVARSFDANSTLAVNINGASGALAVPPTSSELLVTGNVTIAAGAVLVPMS